MTGWHTIKQLGIFAKEIKCFVELPCYCCVGSITSMWQRMAVIAFVHEHHEGNPQTGPVGQVCRGCPQTGGSVFCTRRSRVNVQLRIEKERDQGGQEARSKTAADSFQSIARPQAKIKMYAIYLTLSHSWEGNSAPAQHSESPRHLWLSHFGSYFDGSFISMPRLFVLFL